MASRKHTTKHARTGGWRYQERPGVYSHSRLISLDTLRARHVNRIKENGHPWPTEFSPYTGPFTFTVDEHNVPIAILTNKSAVELAA